MQLIKVFARFLDKNRKNQLKINKNWFWLIFSQPKSIFYNFNKFFIPSLLVFNNYFAFYFGSFENRQKLIKIDRNCQKLIKMNKSQLKIDKNRQNSIEAVKHYQDWLQKSVFVLILTVGCYTTTVQASFPHCRSSV